MISRQRHVWDLPTADRTRPLRARLAALVKPDGRGSSELKTDGRRLTNTLGAQHVLTAHSHHSQANAERAVRHRHARREEHAQLPPRLKDLASMARNGPTMTELGTSLAL
jgi:hypothetical protein